MLRDGKYHLVAHDGVPPDYVEYLIENPFLPAAARRSAASRSNATRSRSQTSWQILSMD
jgi:hypothetical protein